MKEFRKIGIIGAMKIEVDAIKEAMTEKTVYSISGIEFVDGRLEGRPAVVAQCGIGKVFAGICAQTMILKFGVDGIINTGVAGTLTDKLGIGDIAVSTACVQHDMDTSPLGDPVGLISGINVVNIKADEELVKRVSESAKALGINTIKGTIASGDAFICDREKKEWIRDTFDAIACEMEGAAVAQVCYVNKVPFVVIRAISDNADGSADLSYEEFSRKAAENSVRVTGMVVCM